MTKNIFCMSKTDILLWRLIILREKKILAKFMKKIFTGGDIKLNMLQL